MASDLTVLLTTNGGTNTCIYRSGRTVLNTGSELRLGNLGGVVHHGVGGHRVVGNISVPYASNIVVNGRIRVNYGARVLPGAVVLNGAGVNDSYIVNPGACVGSNIVNGGIILSGIGLLSDRIRSNASYNPFIGVHTNDGLNGNIRVNGFIRIGGSIINSNAGDTRLACVNSSSINRGMGFNYKAMAIGCSNGGGRHYGVNGRTFVNYGSGLITPIRVNSCTFATTNDAVASRIPRGTLSVTHTGRIGGPN